MDEEFKQAVWRRAFEIHRQRGPHVRNYADNVIQPGPKDPGKEYCGPCDCYDRALVEMVPVEEPFWDRQDG